MLRAYVCIYKYSIVYSCNCFSQDAAALPEMGSDRNIPADAPLFFFFNLFLKLRGEEKREKKMFLKGKGEQLNHMAVFNDVWNTTGDKNRNRKECCLPNSASLFCFIIQIFVFYLN